jgi:hypothetical protein
MGEIKSTIELVMERTKGMTLSGEEKKHLEEEREARMAQGLAVRYLQGEVALDELIKKAQGSSPPFARTILNAMVEALRPGSDEFAKAVDALERLKGGELQAPLRRARDLSLQFGQALQKRRRKLKAELWEELAQRGVKGSAVEPNVEASPRWTQAVGELQREFEPRLQEIRQSLLAKI